MTPTELAELVGVRPQMVYSYIKSGRITGAWQDIRTKKMYVDDECAVMWANAYTRRQALLREQRRARLESELRGVRYRR